MKINELKLHDRNPRRISPEQLDKLAKSITELSQMMELRPIVIDENNIILGGNMRYRALKKLGYKEIPDNWVKRDDNLTEEQKREFIVKDNVGFGDWEIDILQEDYSIDELTDWGLDIDFDQESDEKEAEEEETIYTRMIKAPIYEPRGENPPLSKLCDMTKYNDLIAQINNSDIGEDEKEFLRIAASRHIVFDYGSCAEYYAHADKSIKNHFEKSALVIIDMDKAIENGFVKMVNQLIDAHNEEQ